MFERRLKIVFGILVLVTLLLLARAAQVQVLEAAYWQEQASKTMRRSQLIETTRGDIVDRHGRPVATDEACLSAAVDYRAIVREPDWMKEQAASRLRSRLGTQYTRAPKEQRQRLLSEEVARVNADIDAMWRTLAQVSGKPLDRALEEIEETKASIVRRVEMRRRYLWYRKYETAKALHDSRDPDPWLKKWLLSGEEGPQIDSFFAELAEQSEPHVILREISNETFIYLKKHQERFPGLFPRYDKHRSYPYGSAACHILGHLGVVTRQDLDKDPFRDPETGDDLRKFLPNDLVGRSGIEALCDRALRGVRGRTERIGDRVEHTDPIPGSTVRLTLDIELQARIERAFENVQWFDKDGDLVEEHEMHGAAVVIDVPTGELLALVSYPTFDLNRFDEEYPRLYADTANLPLLNRATQMALPPGSTVKPMVGIDAIMQGLSRVDERIECTGFLYDSTGHRQPHGKCWVATMYLKELGEKGVAHHPVPGHAPHETGFLSLSDALQRSCNIYFEKIGERLGLEGLSRAFSRFGLGRKTGIGIPEVAGRLPNAYRGPLSDRRWAVWLSSIGQNQILATPIQMANVVATIARDGIWQRPRLLADERNITPGPTTRPAEPDRIDLHIPPAILGAVKEGMYRVVNVPGGTAVSHIKPKGVAVAGKTGTAQVGSDLRVELRDEMGRPILDAQGRKTYEYPPLHTRFAPNPRLPWYRGSGRSGTDKAHAWFIGYAPAQHPRVAFAVVLEYGGSGGADAAPVVNAVLEACLDHGYLAREK